MKNANIFIDVDLTLVDASLKLLSGAREAGVDGVSQHPEERVLRPRPRLSTVTLL